PTEDWRLTTGLRIREGNNGAAAGGPVLPAATDDDDVLAPVDFVRRGGRVARRGQRRLPQQLAGQGVVRVEFSIEVRRADEEQSARRDQRAAVVVAAGVRDPFRNELGILAEWNLPLDGAGVEVNRGERAPGRRDRRVAFGIAEQLLAVAAIFQPAGLPRHARIFALVVAGQQEVDEVVDVARAHVRIAGHPSRALADDRRDGLARAALADVDERRRRRRSLAILAVARGALRVVERRVVVRDQLDDPRHLVRVDIQERGRGIERRAAPFRAAVEAGEHDRALER